MGSDHVFDSYAEALYDNIYACVLFTVHSLENSSFIPLTAETIWMPIISRFFGIVIFMLWREHRPPHFHAKYGDDEVTVEIENGKVNGNMSKRALGLVQEWRELHKEELKHEWELVEQKKALFPIKPLE